MAYVTIQLNELGYLDVQDGTAFPLTFENAPIQDISQRAGSFSKTITLADTANNRKLLGYLFDLNVTSSSFNINRKAACSIIQNGTTILPNAYLQLLSVNKRAPAVPNGEQIVTFSVAIKEDRGQFYLDMADKLVSDLDFSQYNHVYTFTAITSSSAHTYVDGYKYHNFYHGGGNYRLTDYKPGIFLIPMLDKITAANGYSYTWLDRDEVRADKMIIPYGGDKPIMRLDTQNNLRFQAGFIGGQQTINASTSVPTANKVIVWDDDSTRGNFDSGGTYNTGTGKYTADYYGSTVLKAKFQYEIYLSATTDATMAITAAWGSPSPGATLGEGYTVNAFFYKNGSGIGAAPLSNFDSFQFYCGATITTGLNYVKSGVTDEFSIIPAALASTGYNVYPGAQFHVGLTSNVSDIIGFGGSYVISMGWVNSAGTPTNVSVIVKVGGVSADTNLNYFKNEPSLSDINEGSTIFMNDYLPKVQQKQLFADITKAFLLYVTPDKFKPNHLIIQTRDHFYDSGGIEDWTDKFQVGKEYTVKSLPNLQKKKVQFSYKSGAGDVWNKTYYDSVKETYGMLEYTFSNEFVTDTQKIELAVIEPTPINEDLTFGNLVSMIDTQAPKTGVRLLYDCGWITGNTWSFDRLVGATYSTVSFNTYPAALHFYPNPITPTDDLNFGICDYYFYPSWSYLTNNNLYNKYYKRYLNQIETGKLLTGYFKLSELDIATLDFRNKILIHNTYWFLNKIIDYDANSKDGLTKCELISVDEGTRFSPFSVVRRRPNYTDFVSNGSSIGLNPSFNPGSNTVGRPFTGVDVRGRDNTIQLGSESIFIGGIGNNILAKNSTILGTGTTAFGLKTSIIAANDVVANDVENVFVFKNGTTANTSNTAYFENLSIAGNIYSTNKTLIATGGTGPVAGVVKLTGSTATVSTTAVTNSSMIFLSTTATGSTLGTIGHPFVLTKSAVTSFTIRSTGQNDDSYVAWQIVEPY